MTERFSNLGQTTINQSGGITAIASTVTVTSLNGSGNASFHSFPSSGNFRIVFGTDSNSEIALCTSVNTTTKTLTIIRGQEGTQAQAWSNGTTVTIALTAQAVNQMRADVFSVGKYNDRPALGLNSGSYYQTTDGHTPWIWDFDTGMWRPQISGVLGFQPPPASLFATNFNSPGSIADSGKGALVYTGINDSSSIFRGIGFDFTTENSGEYGFVEACVQHTSSATQSSSRETSIGVFLRGTTNADTIVLAHGFDQYTNAPPEFLEVYYYAYNDMTTKNSLAKIPLSTHNGHVFLRIRWDSNFYCEFSYDRNNWFTIFTYVITSYFNSYPNKIGIGGYTVGNTGPARIISFKYGKTYRSTVNASIPVQPQPTIFNPSMNGWLSRTLNH